MSLEKVKEIFQNDKEDIIKTFGGIGAGIGKQHEEYIIVVYLDHRIAETKVNNWKGISVKLEYIGKVSVF